jgi:hypothetical protein
VKVKLPARPRKSGAKQPGWRRHPAECQDELPVDSSLQLVGCDLPISGLQQKPLSVLHSQAEQRRPLEKMLLHHPARRAPLVS